MVSYDIWCQYSINLQTRMETRFPTLAPVFEEDRTRGAVPRLHVHSHGEKCQLGCSFTYTKYSGMTCGEGIESAWAEQNNAAGSTKEQSTGHRQDTLDDYNGYWNWTKLHRLCTSPSLYFIFQFSRHYHLAKYLLNQFVKYYDEWQEAAANFTTLESRFPVEIINQWKEMEKKPFIGRDGKPRSVFQIDSIQGWSYCYCLCPDFTHATSSLTA